MEGLLIWRLSTASPRTVTTARRSRLRYGSSIWRRTFWRACPAPDRLSSRRSRLRARETVGATMNTKTVSATKDTKTTKDQCVHVFRDRFTRREAACYAGRPSKGLCDLCGRNVLGLCG